MPVAARQTVPISTQVASTVKERLDRYVRDTGVQEQRVVEDALAHHLEALEALPERFILRRRVVLSSAEFERVVDLIEHPQQPTEAMKALFRDR